MVGFQCLRCCLRCERRAYQQWHNPTGNVWAHDRTPFILWCRATLHGQLSVDHIRVLKKRDKNLLHLQDHCHRFGQYSCTSYKVLCSIWTSQVVGTYMLPLRRGCASLKPVTKLGVCSIKFLFWEVGSRPVAIKCYWMVNSLCRFIPPLHSITIQLQLLSNIRQGQNMDLERDLSTFPSQNEGHFATEQAES